MLIDDHVHSSFLVIIHLKTKLEDGDDDSMTFFKEIQRACYLYSQEEVECPRVGFSRFYSNDV